MNSLVIKLFGALALLMSGAAWAAEPNEEAAPVTLLTQVQGMVEYSKNGTDWKPVTRNKLLFAGAKIRSGADGSGQFIDQAKGGIQLLAANSEVEVSESGVKAVKGALAAGDGADTALMASLQNRFTKAQRYTTVRRAVIKHDELDLQVPRQITVSSDYPELLWESAGKEYSYRLTLDQQQIEIPPTESRLVRIKLPALSAGAHNYKVELLQNGKAVVESKGEATLRWMTAEEWKKFKDQAALVADQTKQDPFFAAMLFEENGLLVPALDHYQRYFQENADSNELRPLYIHLLHSLKLRELRMAEAEIYNRHLAE